MTISQKNILLHYRLMLGFLRQPNLPRLRHVDYIHYSIQSGKTWLNLPSKRIAFSSIHRYIKAGVMANDWGGSIDNNDEGDYGER